MTHARRLGLTAAAAATLLAVPALSASASTSSSTPAAHVTGLAPIALKGAKDLGAATGLQDVTLVLGLRDQAGLDRLVQAQSTPGTADYHHYLTPAQFTERFAPSAADVATATSWARSAGLTLNGVSPNRTLVQLSGTAQQVGAAFGVVERTVSAGGQVFRAPSTTATLPAAVSAITKSVLGLTTYNAMHTASTNAAPYQTYGAAAYGPKDFQQIYDAPAAVTGTGQSVGVITNGDLTQVTKDLATFQQRNGLPATPLQVVQAGPTSTDTTGADEYDLDTQYSSGFAPGVASVVAYNSATLGDIEPLNRFVTDGNVKTASASYGGCEVLNELSGTVAADDQVFEQAVAQGQSLFVSSGDEGSACSLLINTGYPVGVPDVEYPSSSPYVVAVGGTTLTGQSTQPLREISWVGGGGGYSFVEPAPSWQKTSLPFVGGLTRGVPDVSLDADPSSGYVVVVAGTDTTIGGTSASAPAWNGIWARVLQAHPTAGYAAPALYADASALTDITLGANGIYPATTGYDLNTGLGTADIAKLVATIKG